jgi:hypothetical protein
MIKVNVPIKVETRGSISLGPMPGTPEYEQEQRAKREAEQLEQERPKKVE